MLYFKSEHFSRYSQDSISDYKTMSSTFKISSPKLFIGNIEIQKYGTFYKKLHYDCCIIIYNVHHQNMKS